MLEECGLPYAARPVNIAFGESFELSCLKRAPDDRTPVIIDPAIIFTNSYRRKFHTQSITMPMR